MRGICFDLFPHPAQRSSHEGIRVRIYRSWHPKFVTHLNEVLHDYNHEKQ